MPSGMQVDAPGLLVEQSQHHPLAVTGRNRRDAHVDRAAGDAQTDAPVLRQALLGDVELRHDLQARHDQWRDRPLGLQHLAQDAVDAKADDESILKRLDVDVGGVFLHRLGEDRVDEADDRRVVLALEEIGLLRQHLRQVRKVGGLIETLDRLHGLGAALVGLAQELIEHRLRHALELHRARAESAAPRRAPSARCWCGRRTARRRPACCFTSTPWRLAKAKDRRRSRRFDQGCLLHSFMDDRRSVLGGFRGVGGRGLRGRS